MRPCTTLAAGGYIVRMGAMTQFAVGVVVGAGLVALGVLLTPSREVPPPAGATGSPSPAAATTGLPASAGDASGRAEPEGQLAAAIAELERRLDERLDRATARAPVAGPAAVTIDEAMLARVVAGALERQQRERFLVMSDEELLVEAQRALLPDSNDRLGARRALDVLLERDLSPAQRTSALQQLGVVQRASHDLDGSTRTLQRLIDLCGPDSPTGVEAAYQMVWNMGQTRDYARAIDLANGVARSPGASAVMSMQGRWAAAIMMQNAGNVAEARAAFAAIQRDCGTDPRFESLLEDIRRRLQAK